MVPIIVDSSLVRFQLRGNLVKKQYVTTFMWDLVPTGEFHEL